MKIKVTLKQGRSELTEISTLYRYCNHNRLKYTEIYDHLQTNNVYTIRNMDCKITIEKI